MLISSKANTSFCLEFDCLDQDCTYKAVIKNGSTVYQIQGTIIQVNCKDEEKLIFELACVLCGRYNVKIYCDETLIQCLELIIFD